MAIQTGIQNDGGQPFFNDPSGSVPSAGGIPNSIGVPTIDIGYGYDSQGRVDPNYEDKSLSPFDTVVIGDQQLPGLCRVDVRRRSRFHQKTSIGDQYGTVTLLGLDLADIIVTNKMWTRTQWAAYQQVVRALQKQIIQIAQSSKGQVYAAVTIQYPTLAMLGIGEAYIREIIPPVPTGTQGVWEAKLVLGEFKVPVKGKAGTASGATPNLGSLPNAFAVPTIQSPDQNATTIGTGSVAPGF